MKPRSDQRHTPRCRCIVLSPTLRCRCNRVSTMFCEQSRLRGGCCTAGIYGGVATSRSCSNTPLNAAVFSRSHVLSLFGKVDGYDGPDRRVALHHRYYADDTVGPRCRSTHGLPSTFLYETAFSDCIQTVTPHSAAVTNHIEAGRQPASIPETHPTVPL